MDRETKIQLLKAVAEKERRTKENKNKGFFPDEGEFARDKYPKHLEFFAAGAKYKERAFIAANRSGKTVAGAYEMVCHLTGNYPHWWEGRRFEQPITAWAAGITNETTRDVIQMELLGRRGEYGTGMIPKDAIVRTTSRAGVTDAVQDLYVKHVTGGTSQLGFKSYVQGMDSFMGTSRHVVWFDEEMEQSNIYSEALTRTMTTEGIIYCTFTPLKGLSEVVLNFLPGGKRPAGGIVPSKIPGMNPSKYVVMASWEDTAHIKEDQKKMLLASFSPHEAEARSRGIPQLGSGAIYPVPESEVIVDPFEIPASWPRAYGMDVGWNKTAVIWAAYDKESDVVYLYSEHYRGQAEPSIHADAIKARGKWIPGVIDPASEGRSQKDGARLIDDYYILGLDICSAERTLVESGLLTVWQRLSSGRLKVFSNCQKWLEEFRVYRRDDKGKIVKNNDHLMDATRYLIMSGLDRAESEPQYDDDENEMPPELTGKDNITGY